MLVYLITNSINNKKYIGATTRRLCERKGKHLHLPSQTNPELKKDIILFGQDSFSFEVLKKCKSLDEMYETEINKIKELNTLFPNGYNLKTGGVFGGLCCDATKKKMSDAQKGSKNYWYGKTFSEEHKKKIGAKSKKRGMDKAWKKRVELNQIKVYCKSNDKIYNSCKEASADLNISRATISRIISGKQKENKFKLERKI